MALVSCVRAVSIKFKKMMALKSSRLVFLVLPLVFIAACAPGLDTIRTQQSATAARIAELESRVVALEKVTLENQQAVQSHVTHTTDAIQEVRGALQHVTTQLDSVGGFTRRQMLNLDSQLALLTDEIREFEIRMTGRKSAHGGITPAFDLRRAYSKGIRAYNAGAYREAIGAFKLADNVAVLPDLADNARYWIGECQYALHEYDDALGTFKRVLVLPQSNKRDDAFLKIAQIHLLNNRPEEALKAFKLLVTGYPESEYAKEAQEGIFDLEN